jgi:hypothetical protein
LVGLFTIKIRLFFHQGTFNYIGLLTLRQCYFSFILLADKSAFDRGG